VTPSGCSPRTATCGSTSAYQLGGGEHFDLDYALYGLIAIQRRAAKSRGDPD
jgi:hypothetical protein